MKPLSANKFLTFLTLFSSTGTLICCALPALLVSLGMGAVLAGMASSIPGMIWVSENKVAVFLFAGLMLVGNGYWIWSQRNAPCPLDPELREACISGRKFSAVVYFVSLAVFSAGVVFAFILPWFAA